MPKTKFDPRQTLEKIAIQNPDSDNRNEPNVIKVQFRNSSNPLLKWYRAGKIDHVQYRAGEIYQELLQRAQISPLRSPGFEPTIRGTGRPSGSVSDRALDAGAELNRLGQLLGQPAATLFERIIGDHAEPTTYLRSVLGSEMGSPDGRRERTLRKEAMTVVIDGLNMLAVEFGLLKQAA